MSAIVTNQFRSSNAEVFYNSFASSNYYLSLGRPTSWVDDEAPPTAFESGPQLAKIHRDIIFSLYINQANTSMVIPRINWKSDTIYDMYDDSVSSANPTTNGYTSLNDAKYYVITSAYNVYVCLDNYDGASSTIEPTGTSQNIFTTTDGYRWKFLYNIPTSEVQKFLSLDFMPVLEDATIASFATSSSIETALLKSGGAGYVPGSYSVSVHGDGSGAVVDIVVGTDKTISSVSISSPGSGYSFVSLDLSPYEDTSETTTPAVINLIISPAYGLGGNNKKLLNSVFVMTSITITSDVANNDIITDQEFRQISLIKNPTSSGSLTTALSLSALKVMQVSGYGTDSFKKDEKIVGSNSGAEGTVVNFDSTTGKLEYIQQSEIGLGLDSSGDIKDFTTGDAITGAISTTSAGIQGFTASEQDLYSGDLLYTENRPPIFRTTDQEENIKLVIEF